jgi:hypothetical protein
LKLKRYKEIIRIQDQRQYLNKIAQMSDLEVVNTYDKEINAGRIKELKAKLKILRETNSDLIYKLCQIQNQDPQTYSKYIVNIDDVMDDDV